MKFLDDDGNEIDLNKIVEPEATAQDILRAVRYLLHTPDGTSILAQAVRAGRAWKRHVARVGGPEA